MEKKKHLKDTNLIDETENKLDSRAGVNFYLRNKGVNMLHHIHRLLT